MRGNGGSTTAAFLRIARKPPSYGGFVQNGGGRPAERVHPHRTARRPAPRDFRCDSAVLDPPGRHQWQAFFLGLDLMGFPRDSTEPGSDGRPSGWIVPGDFETQRRTHLRCVSGFRRIFPRSSTRTAERTALRVCSGDRSSEQRNRRTGRRHDGRRSLRSSRSCEGMNRLQQGKSPLLSSCHRVVTPSVIPRELARLATERTCDLSAFTLAHRRSRRSLAKRTGGGSPLGEGSSRRPCGPTLEELRPMRRSILAPRFRPAALLAARIAPLPSPGFDGRSVLRPDTMDRGRRLARGDGNEASKRRSSAGESSLVRTWRTPCGFQQCCLGRPERR